MGFAQGRNLCPLLCRASGLQQELAGSGAAQGASTQPRLRAAGRSLEPWESLEVPKTEARKTWMRAAHSGISVCGTNRILASTGKQPPHSAVSIRHGFFLISNILMSVLGDGEGQVDAGTENHTSLLMWGNGLAIKEHTFHPTKPALGLSDVQQWRGS